MKKLFLNIAIIVIFQSSFSQQQVIGSYLASEKELVFPKAFVMNCFKLGHSKSFVEEIRQGWGHLAINKSIINDTIRIGNKKYSRGLGTHANSEILVVFSKKAKRFVAEVGYDKNTRI